MDLTNAEKKRFIRQLTAGVRDMLLAKVDRTPQDWDGHELREWIADAFARETTDVLSRSRKRYRSYRNALARI